MYAIITSMAFEGILTINKPANITSYDVIRAIKKIIGKQKIGHAGTLDPFATGVLIVAIGKKYTKQLSTYQNMTKTYRFCIQLGIETTTLDPEGDIVDETPLLEPLTDETINSVLASFLGKTQQIPPIFSAKKINGQRAYKLARQGKGIEPKETTITIHDISLLAYHSKTNEIECRVICEKGTYIRSLSRDIAKALKTVGFTKTLIREAVGEHTLDKAISLESLQTILTTA
ncbi:tRNA pseudouridine(55) synthase TruB [bacterium]|nr:tRNA pseudouridine(55) synthase TruB [bacterium]